MWFFSIPTLCINTIYNIHYNCRLKWALTEHKQSLTFLKKNYTKASTIKANFQILTCNTLIPKMYSISQNITPWLVLSASKLCLLKKLYFMTMQCSYFHKLSQYGACFRRFQSNRNIVEWHYCSARGTVMNAKILS